MLFPDIRERLDKATQGPWKADAGNAILYITEDDGEPILAQLGETLCGYSKDATFIAHSPTDITRLLRALDLAVEALASVASNKLLVNIPLDEENLKHWVLAMRAISGEALAQLKELSDKSEQDLSSEGK